MTSFKHIWCSKHTGQHTEIMAEEVLIDDPLSPRLISYTAAGVKSWRHSDNPITIIGDASRGCEWTQLQSFWRATRGSAGMCASVQVKCNRRPCTVLLFNILLSLLQPEIVNDKHTHTHTHTHADTQCQTVPSHLFLIPPQNTLTPLYTLSSSTLSSFSLPSSRLLSKGAMATSAVRQTNLDGAWAAGRPWRQHPTWVGVF